MPETPRSLADELKQNRPWSGPAEEALVSVMRTAAILRRLLTQLVEPFGISPAQYNVLRILRGARPDGLPTLAVRDRLVEEAPGITRLIDKLERAKFVARDRTGRDRPTVRVRITPAGLELLDQADAVVKQVHAQLARGIPDEGDLRDLVALLEQVRASLV